MKQVSLYNYPLYLKPVAITDASYYCAIVTVFDSHTAQAIRKELEKILDSQSMKAIIIDLTQLRNERLISTEALEEFSRFTYFRGIHLIVAGEVKKHHSSTAKTTSMQICKDLKEALNAAFKQEGLMLTILQNSSME